MLELHAKGFLHAVTELRQLISIFAGIGDRQNPVSVSDRTVVLGHLSRLIGELSKFNARSAVAAAERLQSTLRDEKSIFTVHQAMAALNDIESRFSDHLADIRLFVIPDHEIVLFQEADVLVGNPSFTSLFPRSSFEIEEAGKCVALGRYTASVFHSMRMLELGIGALAGFLGIPDPIKVTDRSWGSILKSIEQKLEEKWPSNTRLPGSEGAKLGVLYATLDAVKNPWRNSTMHVETIYAPHEAMHILRCSGYFLLELMKHCDEGGSPAIPGKVAPSASGAPLAPPNASAQGH